MLCTVNYILNDEKLELRDIAIYEAKQTDLKRLLEQQRANQALSRAVTDFRPEQTAHNTYEVEQAVMAIVRRGDSAALQKWISAAPAVRGGILAADQLRQIKNTFVVTITLVSRAAIQSGMDTEDAFSLSDAYIQKCELMDSPERIMNLQYHMILEFTERVEHLHAGAQSSQLVLEVTRYIQHHLSEPISTEDIANQLYLSRPHLSQKFKKETGLTLTDFFLQQKTREATVYLLGHFQKSHGAQEPDQHIAGNSFLTACGHLGLHLAFRKGKGRGAEDHGKNQRQRQKGYHSFSHGLPPIRVTAGWR